MRRSTGDRKFLFLLAAAALLGGGYLFFSRSSQDAGLQPVPGGAVNGLKLPPGGPVAGTMRPSGLRVVEQKVVELNSATLEDIETLPGITPEYAKKIIEGRPYQSMADLSRTGIPRRILDEISPPAVIRVMQNTPR